LAKHKDILLSAKNIAIVRTDKLGDMMLTLPMVPALKSINPNAKISIIASGYTRKLLECYPQIDNLFFIEDFSGGIDDIFKEIKFDAVFFPRPKPHEAKASARAGIPLRVGSLYRLYSFYYNHRVGDHRKKGEYHEAEYNCRQISSVTGSDVQTKLVPPEVTDEMLKSLSAKFGNKDKYFIVHPGSGGSANDWSAENFGKAAKEIYEKYTLIPVVTGLGSEQELCNRAISECSKAVNLCGMLNLEEMIALISKASLFISNSTGVLHIAASLDVPVIGLYPNTSHISARRWGPYSKKRQVVSPTDNTNLNEMDDMSKIEVKDVVLAAERLLD
jgi:heptosyltransferase-3